LLARQAGVDRLVLIHYPVRGVNPEAWRSAASDFPGPLDLAQDGDVYFL
jgi:ribonuclease BN (tRNA processing enzyme)